ncbi:MAG: type II toxin-antitoxin system HicA family toxin [Dehalococcoidales bacterium]|nr:type II toxin-antitoxin system HicA family toxin [Dehalococcoidales bacterium]
MKFSELVRLLERNGFELIKEKGSVRYCCKEGLNKLIRVDYHGSREIPTGTCDAIFKLGLLSNRLLLGGLGLAVILQAIVIYTPPPEAILHRAFIS